MSSVVGVSVKIQGEDHGSGLLSQLKSLLTSHSNLGDRKRFYNTDSPLWGSKGVWEIKSTYSITINTSLWHN